MKRNWKSGECVNPDHKRKCEHTATHDGDLCRFCQGRENYGIIVALRSLFGIKAPSFDWKMPVRKSKPKVVPIQKTAVRQVQARDVKPGMVIAPDHGEVISVERHDQTTKLTGRQNKKKVWIFKRVKHNGVKGILFTTSRRKLWYPYDAQVWVER